MLPFLITKYLIALAIMAKLSVAQINILDFLQFLQPFGNIASELLTKAANGLLNSIFGEPEGYESKREYPDTALIGRGSPYPYYTYYNGYGGYYPYTSMYYYGYNNRYPYNYYYYYRG
ncbi:unnamed protein product [Cercopithifilaria johnstoni]|uniref:Uncharacterized protein n=1 Tax=Cercopithifilaria johnstoni TaxID=2874296 RepID=A0A8J2Q1Q3_9BILA|nr:unnamed protein product [Cercopithifilaria johnstoni]